MAIFGWSSTTLWPVSSDSEAAVREKAMLISSVRASFWRSLSCIGLPLKGFAYGVQHLVGCERFIYEHARAARIDHLARRALNIGTRDDHAGMRVHFAKLVKNVHPVHPGHRQ